MYGLLFGDNFRFDTCNYSNTLRIFAQQGIRLEGLDSSSSDLEQSIDDLDYTSIYFDNLDLTLNDLELSIIEL